MRPSLRVLADRGFVLPTGDPATGTYEYRHSLVRETAYETLAHWRREVYHARAGRFMETDLDPSSDPGAVNLLAYHFTRSNRPDRALGYALLAAESGARQYANEVALSWYDSAQTALDRLVPLAAMAIVLAVVLGVTLGLVSGLNRDTPIDYAAVAFSTAGASVPNIVTGIVLIIVFALSLHWFPTGGWYPLEKVWDAVVAGRISDAMAGFGAFLSRSIMPASTLAFAPAAILARVTRAAVLDVVSQDYIRTARAKGLPEILVVVRHVLRNAAIPIITLTGPIAADLIAGSFIVESIFGIPGIGKNLVPAVGACWSMRWRSLSPTWWSTSFMSP